MTTNNVERLKAILSLFEIPIAEAARSANVSRPLVSGVLHGKVKPSNSFWSKMERGLADAVASRSGQVFAVEPVPEQATAKILELVEK